MSCSHYIFAPGAQCTPLNQRSQSSRPAPASPRLHCCPDPPTQHIQNRTLISPDISTYRVPYLLCLENSYSAFKTYLK